MARDLRGRIGASENRRVNMALALEYRIAGLSFPAIGRKMNVNRGTAFRYVQDALGEIEKLSAERAEKVRTLELARLDHWTILATKRASEGSVQAIVALTKIQERRARLLGLDMPINVNMTSELSLSLDAAEHQLRAKLGIPEAVEMTQVGATSTVYALPEAARSKEPEEADAIAPAEPTSSHGEDAHDDGA